MKRPLALLLVLAAASCTSTGRKFDPRSKDAVGAVDPEFSKPAAASAPPSALLQPPADGYTLGPGDKLDIEILGETGSRAETFITPDSKLYFNLLPGLAVGGMTTAKLKQVLESQLAHYYKHPQVSVTLEDAVNQRIWVLGRLNNPGIQSLKRPTRVLDAISLAGGLFSAQSSGTTEELADLSHSFISRKGQMLPVDFLKLLRDGDLKQNIYLQPNDFIYLPSSLTDEVYVLGAVMESRPVRFMNNMTLLTALSRGQGTRPDADLSRVSIIRGSLTEPRIATLNANDILKGKATNVRLAPGDIIFIPGAGQASLGASAHDALNTFVRVVAASEGNNAATAKPANVGVNVNIGGTN